MGTRLPGLGLPGLGLPGLGRDPLDLDTDASAGPSSGIQMIASQAMLETARLPGFEAVAAER